MQDQNTIARNWRDLIRPKKLEVDTATLTETYHFLRLLYVKLGNSLRRVLLSSLQGSAITTVRIEGALHEFTTVPGVVEDVTDIILNVKTLLIRMDDATQRTLVIDKQGEGEVTAGDIQCPTGVTVLRPEQHMAEGKPIGVIPIDSLFSPIQKVNYRVTNARVGHRTDYDRLSIEVWTDGSVRPEDAVAFAAALIAVVPLSVRKSKVTSVARTANRL